MFVGLPTFVNRHRSIDSHYLVPNSGV